MNNPRYMLDIAEAGLGLDIGTEGTFKDSLLIVLLDLEDALDKGRVLASGPFRSDDGLSGINQKMDLLREKISGLIAGMDKEQVRRIMKDRGESLKVQFKID